MYSELFKLSEPPFRLTPDPEFLFASKQHARAKAYMESTIWLADGFVVITGEIGAGKTTLIESFLHDLPEDVVLAHVSQTQLSEIEFLQAVLVEFGFREFHDRKVELLSTLKDFMIDQYAKGKTLLLIVDEAQNLSHKVLEEIRLLSGIESQKEKPLRIILAGQPELADKLDSLRLEQLRQRVRLRFHLSTLSKRETGEYIQHRLDVAGANGRRIFDKDAVDLIYRYAGGVPRLINVLCDTAMLCGFSEGKDTIDVGLIREAIDELQWVEYEKRFENRGRFSAPHSGRRTRRLRLADDETRAASLAAAHTRPHLDEDDDEPYSAVEPHATPARARIAVDGAAPRVTEAEGPDPDQEAAPAEPAPAEPADDELAGAEPAAAELADDEPAAAESAADELAAAELADDATGQREAPVTAEPETETPAAEPDSPPARFEVHFKDQHITDFELTVGRMVVGRTGDNDLQIRSRFISRHHIQVTTDLHRSVVEDLNSTNGMFIGSRKVQYHALIDGDAIQLGEHKLVYRDMRQHVEPVEESDDTRASAVPIVEPGESVFPEYDGIETQVIE